MEYMLRNNLTTNNYKIYSKSRIKTSSKLSKEFYLIKKDDYYKILEYRYLKNITDEENYCEVATEDYTKFYFDYDRKLECSNIKCSNS